MITLDTNAEGGNFAVEASKKKPVKKPSTKPKPPTKPAPPEPKK